MSQQSQDASQRHDGQGASASREKKVKIKVTADPGTEGRLVDWSYKASFENGGGSSNGKEMKFDRGPGYFKLEFALVDNSGFDLAFLQDVADAMWVATGNVCPPPGPGNGGGQIEFEENPVGNKLTVINLNSSEVTLCYALRFSGTKQADPGQPGAYVPPYVYDPIMINEGGGGRFF